MIFLIAGFLFVSYATGSVLPNNASQLAVRDEKVFNVLNVVRFPNDVCTQGTTSGTCYASNECAELGGQKIGACANGFGVCCSLKATCDDKITKNNTYFLLDGAVETSPCKADVCRIDSNICQIRLDFDEFDLDQPVSGTYDTSSKIGMYGDTVCQNAIFNMESDNGNTTPLCGNNKGYHMIVEAVDGCNLMEATWTPSSKTRTLKILVSQIPCDVRWKPPAGCTQWYTGVSGVVASYNWLGGVHLADQKYRNCIRREKGMCSIQYYADSGEFEVSGTSASTYDGGSKCFLDYVIIPRGGVSTQASNRNNQDRFCGGGFGISSTETTVYTRNYPFMIGVQFDGSENVGAPPVSTPPELTKGFRINYSQNIACSILEN